MKNEPHCIVHGLLTHGRKQWNVKAMIDSGATGLFMDVHFANQHQIPLTELERPQKLHLFDGQETSAGRMTKQATIFIELGAHRERAKFLITKLGDYDVVLGLPWLRKHSPNIDWDKEQIAFDSDSARRSAYERQMRNTTSNYTQWKRSLLPRPRKK